MYGNMQMHAKLELLQKSDSEKAFDRGRNSNKIRQIWTISNTEWT